MEKSPSKKSQVYYYNKLYANRKSSMAPWNLRIAEYLSTRRNKKKARVLEIGCGKGDLLYYLSKNGYDQKNLSGIDLSSSGPKIAKKLMPKGHFEGKSFYDYKINKIYDYIILAEVIEHFEDFNKAVEKLVKFLKRDGKLIISFPNYFNLPWLGVRLASEYLNKPNWIVLQPIDRIYTFSKIKNEFKKNGFSLVYKTGSVYLPPILFEYENKNFYNFMDKLKLQFLAFHPVMVFKK